MNFPADLKYTKDHEWIRVDGDVAYVGITDYAQGELGEIVFVDITTEGEVVAKEEVFGTIEAVKTVSDLFMPVSGEVIEANAELDDKPELVNEDVAERAGYDISTISRVSNSKYVQTNFGIYPLKYFFSESMQTDSGEEISTREVKKIMKEHIDGEDKRKPLTDEELTSILKEKGYIIARRTVAKYREQLGIPVARLRKEI